MKKKNTTKYLKIMMEIFDSPVLIKKGANFCQSCFWQLVQFKAFSYLRVN